MNWHLAVLHDGLGLFLKELDAQEMKSFNYARDVLMCELAIEEIFDVVLSNYRDFTEELFRLGNRGIFQTEWGYSVGSRERTAVNRVALNVLSACKLYIDARRTKYSEVFGVNSEIFRYNKEATSNIYDSCKEYRICDKLKNYIQHCGFPITMVRTMHAAQDVNTQDGTAFFNPQMDRDLLLKNGDAWTARVKEDLLGEDRWISIHPLIARYVSCISELHAKLISQTASEITKIEQLCNEWNALAKSTAKIDPVFPVLVDRSLDEMLSLPPPQGNEEWIPTDAVRRLQELRKINIPRHAFHVTSNISTLTPYLQSVLEKSRVLRKAEFDK